VSNLPKPPRLPKPGIPAGVPSGTWKGSRYVSPFEGTDAQQRARLIEQFKKEREEEAKKKPTLAEKMERSVEMAGARAVEAMRYGMRYEEVLARILQAMDEEVCKVIHDE
jgi:hypothetical protein